MEDVFKIYVDRLREGREEAIIFTVDAQQLQLSEELQRPIEISGVAYATDSHLILRLQVMTEAEVACAICNEPTTVRILVEDLYHAEDLAKITGLVFNFEDLVRDAILLQLPHVVECNEGQCPEREQLSKYFSRRE